VIEELRAVWPEIERCEGSGPVYGWPASAKLLVPYSTHHRLVCSNDAHKLESWFHNRALVPTLALDTEFEQRDCAGEEKNVMVLAQFACHGSVLLTNCITHPEVLRILLSPEVKKVGNDLRGDWTALEATLMLSDVTSVTLLDGTVVEVASVLAAGSAAAGWHDITELLPLHRIDAGTEALARFVLDRTASWKRTVDHQRNPPHWADLESLDRTALVYAMSDACFVWDVMVVVEEKVVTQGGRFPWLLR
jgi:hypothetical protein